MFWKVSSREITWISLFGNSCLKAFNGPESTMYNDDTEVLTFKMTNQTGSLEASVFTYPLTPDTSSLLLSLIYSPLPRNSQAFPSMESISNLSHTPFPLPHEPFIPHCSNPHSRHSPTEPLTLYKASLHPSTETGGQFWMAPSPHPVIHPTHPRHKALEPHCVSPTDTRQTQPGIWYSTSEFIPCDSLLWFYFSLVPNALYTE